MVTAIDDLSLPGQARDRAAIASSDRARTRAFDKARRHSRSVRVLRIVLPAAALASLSLYGVFMRVTLPSIGGLSPGTPQISLENLAMLDPRYEGYGKDGSRFTVTAKQAQQDWKQTGPVRLTGISGQMHERSGNTTDLSARRGTFDTKANVLELLDEIDIRGQSGLTARLTQATVLVKEGRITSQQPVTVGLPAGEVRGNTLAIDQKARSVLFAGGVVALLKPAQKEPAAATASPRAAAGGLAASRFAAGSSAPVEVRSPELAIDDATKVALFKGGVTAVQGAATMTTSELEVLYAGGTEGGQAAGPGVTGAIAAQGKVKRIVARSNVVITQGNDRATSLRGEFDPEAEVAQLLGKVELTSGADQKATAERADFNARTDTAVLTGNVVMTGGADRRVTAERAEMNTRTDAAVLTGDVVVQQARNSLRGRRLALDRQAGTLQLTTPGGRIAARFHQGDADGAARKPASKPAQGDGVGFTFRTDASAPIDLEADTLDASDQTRTATFRGDVRAVQGDFTIRTAEMIAHYTGQASLAASSRDGKAAAGAKAPAAQLQRIRASRKVLISSARDDQNATGDWGEFDVKANTVTLGGNVTMTQGQQVVRGDKLVIDTTTGLARIYGGGDKAPASGEAAAVAGPRLPGQSRPSAVFYPGQIKELAKKRAESLAGAGRSGEAKADAKAEPAKRAPSPAASSWDASVNGAPASPAGKSPN